MLGRRVVRFRYPLTHVTHAHRIQLRIASTKEDFFPLQEFKPLSSYRRTRSFAPMGRIMVLVEYLSFFASSRDLVSTRSYHQVF